MNDKKEIRTAAAPVPAGLYAQAIILEQSELMGVIRKCQ